jgi:flagellar protein FliO/FliZ
LSRLGLLLLLPLQSVAADAPAPGISSGNYLQAALALLLIIGLLMATAWLARKVSGGKGFGQGGMKVIGGVALGPREKLVLVEVGDTWLVIGLVPGQIRTLHQLPKGSDFDLSQAAQGNADAPFKQWLKTVTERNRNA